MDKYKVLYIALVLIAVAFIFHGHSTDDDADSHPRPALDFSKPVYTTEDTIACPNSLFYDPRTDHAPARVVAMFFSSTSRIEKAHELGCEALREGLLVYATKSSYSDDLVNVDVFGFPRGALFTIENELTNSVPGQTEEERQQLARAHINKSDVPYQRPVSALSAATDTLFTIPAQNPIFRGTGVAATDPRGYGAMICPDEDRMKAALVSLGKDEWTPLKTFGCSYVPPRTPMISRGPNEQRSLVNVTVQTLEGIQLNGVTFPNMFVLQQRESDVEPAAPTIESGIEQSIGADHSNPKETPGSALQH